MIVLGSATPSLETRYNSERGKYTRLVLPERIEQRPMPQVELVDMRQEFLEAGRQQTFSRVLINAVTERLANGEQTMLLLNRRGLFEFRDVPQLWGTRGMRELFCDADDSSAGTTHVCAIYATTRKRSRVFVPSAAVNTFSS
ncbi:MAG: hypothetical protein WDO18_05845 [Acidobacteriota bacterium]